MNAPGRRLGKLPVNRIRPAYEQVAEQLRELIVQGAIVPGDRLPVEADLAALFGVSRATVREALRLLSSRNLVYAVRGATGGTFVAETDPAALSDYLQTGIGLLSGSDAISLDELLAARQLLEVPAARFAATNRTQEHLSLLHETIELEPDPPEEGSVRYDQHRRFHEVLLEASGNRLLEVMTLPVFGVIRSRFVVPPTEREVWQEIEADHVDILQCVTDGDADSAARLMEEHLVRLNAVYRSMEVVGRTDRAAGVLRAADPR